MKERKSVDISELYDLFTERKNCYFVCCDIKHLVPINEISHKAGDLAILEEMKRMNAVAGPDDIVFRIGGDEFTLLTNSEDIDYARKLCDQIRAFYSAALGHPGQQRRLLNNSPSLINYCSGLILSMLLTSCNSAFETGTIATDTSDVHCPKRHDTLPPPKYPLCLLMQQSHREDSGSCCAFPC